MSNQPVPFRRSAEPPLSRQSRRALTAELFSELALIADDDELAGRLREQIVLTNLQVAQALAKRFGGRGVDLEDLEQTAYVSLIRAVRRFDAGLGSDFLVYAVPTINGDLKRHFRDYGWMIRVPRRLQEAQRLLEADSSITSMVDRNSDAWLSSAASRLGLPVDDVREAVTARGCFSPASLDRLVDYHGENFLGDLGTAAGLDATELRLLLDSVMKSLSPRDRKVLHLRYFEDMTQKEIGHELGVTQPQAARLLARIHRDLRRQLTGLAQAS